MKIVYIIIGLLLISLVGIAQSSVFYSREELTKLLNEEVQKEINWVRQDPERYRNMIKVEGRLDLKRYQSEGNRKWFIMEKSKYYESKETTHEGVSAYREMDKFLKHQKTLLVYTYEKSLRAEAKKQCEYIFRSGNFSHDRPDGKGLSYVKKLKGEGLMLVGEVLAKLDNKITSGEYNKTELNTQIRAIAQEIVIGWIVDDGIPKRGHRSAIFHEQHKYFGAYCLIDEKGTVICAVEFSTLPME